MSERQKPPELIQAQVAAFATETEAIPFQSKETLLTELGGLVAGESVTLPESQIPASAQGDYVKYLRTVGGRHEAIRGRAELLSAYAPFKPKVEDLKRQLANPDTSEEQPTRLGSGSFASVYTINLEGVEYAVRMPESESASVVDSHIAGAILSKGEPHQEQVVAASYEDGVTVSEILPGDALTDMTLAELEQITPTQLEQLVDTVISAYGRGNLVDVKPGNILFDPEQGFGIVDLHARIGNHPDNIAGELAVSRSLGQTVGMLGEVLSRAGLLKHILGLDPSMPNPTASEKITCHKKQMDLLANVRAITKSKLSGRDGKDALQGIDRGIRQTEQGIAQIEWHVTGHRGIVPSGWRADQPHAEKGAS